MWNRFLWNHQPWYYRALFLCFTVHAMLLHTIQFPSVCFQKKFYYGLLRCFMSCIANWRWKRCEKFKIIKIKWRIKEKLKESVVLEPDDGAKWKQSQKVGNYKFNALFQVVFLLIFSVFSLFSVTSFSLLCYYLMAVEMSSEWTNGTMWTMEPYISLCVLIWTATGLLIHHIHKRKCKR